ncbi:MAG TPA: oligosaccharide repeat unit polymerase [Candidatus Lachnoclostridium stercoripullorum]|uniref:Oligosaccharide repeat unit polymerase n=1 Tax=Candidatus Lachnoclostridium stercoripullorum TaxID=2838635 RepID=A0A9D2AXE9_9FIRM|nr:oligosaccharide repeat unit polymerase [Candidatus Lachnoclostridium stercoripullorum]
MAVYGGCHAAAFLLDRAGLCWPAGFCLMGAALWLYISDYRRSGCLVHLRGLFSLFWIGGQGVACLKLSRLQVPWSPITWICFFLAYSVFYLTFAWLSGEISLGGKRGRNPAWPAARTQGGKPLGGVSGAGLFECLLGVTAVSLAAFCFEAWYLGYIPFLVRGVPHAYSYFHVTGVHYFTVSCVLAPALGVLFFVTDRGRSGQAKRLLAAAAVLIALAIPILCVSRFQLILAVALAVFVYILWEGSFPLAWGAGLAVLMVAAYAVLTVARSHDVAYLNGIFEMKNESTPIFITQPYMYIANNYENFNYLVEHLEQFAWGMRSLFPLWALTGLKFVMPSLANYPILVNKEELTTVTLFYDAYYDFGAAGVILLSGILGAVCFLLMRKLSRMQNPVDYLFYAQIGVYLSLSFFTTWFSNPTTWFYLAVTAALWLYCRIRRGRG